MKIVTKLINSTWWKQFWCYHRFGPHNSHQMQANEMNTCNKCSKYIAGPDGWH